MNGLKMLEEARKRPVMSGVTLVGAAGAVLLFMNILPGLELIVSIKRAPLVAQAALEKAEEANEWIAAYIAEAQKQREMEQKLAEQAAEYQRQMLELQKQQQQWQAPNQSSQPQRPPPQMQTIPNLPSPQPQWEWRQTEEGDWYCQGERESWWPNEAGYCE